MDWKIEWLPLPGEKPSIRERAITTMSNLKMTQQCEVMSRGFSDLVIVVVKPEADEGVVTYPRIKLLVRDRKVRGEGRDMLTRRSPQT